MKILISQKANTIKKEESLNFKRVIINQVTINLELVYIIIKGKRVIN